MKIAMWDRARTTRAAALFLRLALAAGFLSAVADRFGLWGPPGSPGVAWGAFDPFVAYTRTLLTFLPPSVVLAAAWIATAAETLLGIGLIAGIRLPAVATASGLLLLSFAVSMTAALGPEAALSYSVWTAAAGAFVLATLPEPEATKTKNLKFRPSAAGVSPRRIPPPFSRRTPASRSACGW